MTEGSEGLQLMYLSSSVQKSFYIESGYNLTGGGFRLLYWWDQAGSTYAFRGHANILCQDYFR